MRRNLVLVATLASISAVAQTPPSQPTFGPGGGDYAHAAVQIRGPYIPSQFGDDERFEYRIYEPDQPRPRVAPVILFLHGFQASGPSLYLRWIRHLVRKGNIVVQVRWDQGLLTTSRFADQAQAGWEDALARISSPGTEEFVEPALDRSGALLTAYVGHSAGNWIAALLAVRSTRPTAAFPSPKALALFEPAGPPFIPTEDFTLIRPETMLMLVVGDDDRLVCEGGAKLLWLTTPQIPAANKEYLLVKSDSYGSPALPADHFFPLAISLLPGSEDTRDFYVTYRLSTALTDCAFAGTNCNVALGDGVPAQTDMGFWSDGRPVKSIEWLPFPLTSQASCAER